MNAKIERVGKEIEKTSGKICDLQARLRELEKQKTELENTEIVDVVRGMNISFADLAELLKAARATSGQLPPHEGKNGLRGGPGLGPKSKAGKPASIAPTDTEDKEDTEE